MRIFFLVCFLFQYCTVPLYSQTDVIEQQPLSIGDILQFKSTVLDESRMLNIYLPASYNVDSSKQFPVIYVLDGSLDEDIIHIAGLVQFCSFSWINDVEESIVVGIANVDRKRDFTYPSSNPLDIKELPTSGGSAKFMLFLEDEVKPMIEARYRTTSHSTLIGQSLGGLLASEVLITKPMLFDRYIIVSPSLWWDDQSLLERKSNLDAAAKEVFIAVGKEGEIMEKTAKALFDAQVRLRESQDAIYFNFLEDKTHADALHQAVYNAFLAFRKK